MNDLFWILIIIIGLLMLLCGFMAIFLVVTIKGDLDKNILKDEDYESKNE